MKIGFTGTRDGMTEKQMNTVYDLLAVLKASEFHHGQCEGADEEACLIATQLGIRTVSHPPINDYMKSSVESDEVRSPAEYLERDRCIVDSTDILIGTPRGEKEEHGSGTWYTIRYSRSTQKPRYIVYPTGEVAYESK